MVLDTQKLLSLLACPKCHASLVEGENVFVCTNGECRLRFSITHEIPVMLAEEAIQLEFEEWSRHANKNSNGVQNTEES